MSDEEHHFESKADAGASKTYPQQAGTIRKNGYIVIKNRPCKVSPFPFFMVFFLFRFASGFVCFCQIFNGLFSEFGIIDSDALSVLFVLI